MAVPLEDIISSSSGSDGTSSLSDGASGDLTSGGSSDLDLQTLESQQQLNELQTNLNNNLNDAVIQGGESIKSLTERSRLSRSLLSKRADFVCKCFVHSSITPAELANWHRADNAFDWQVLAMRHASALKMSFIVAVLRVYFHFPLLLDQA